MKNKFVMAVALTAMIAAAVMVPNAMAGNGGNGNGAPSGPHYNLNLIGVDKNNNNGLPENNCGNVIFVKLYGKSTIWLNESNTFAVVDCDATDANGGTFDLPAPNNQYDQNGNWIPDSGNYTVWARAVGTPGGNANITTCATDPLSGETVCNTNYLITRTKGKSTFADVTKQLTTVTYVNSLGKTVTVNIFDPSLQGYFWSYDNNGIKVVQLRFYPTNK